MLTSPFNRKDEDGNCERCKRCESHAMETCCCSANHEEEGETRDDDDDDDDDDTDDDRMLLLLLMNFISTPVSDPLLGPLIPVGVVGGGMWG